VPIPYLTIKYERTLEIISTGYYVEIFLKGVKQLAQHKLLVAQGANTFVLYMYTPFRGVYESG
jgi:hypothetical protein